MLQTNWILNQLLARALSFQVESDSALKSLILSIVLSEKSATFRDHALARAGLVVVMDTILFLLVAGAIVGFALGLCFSWVAILASGFALASFASILLYGEGVGPLAGVGTIVVCLTVNQLAYLAGVMVKVGGGRKPPSNVSGSVWVG